MRKVNTQQKRYIGKGGVIIKIVCLSTCNMAFKFFCSAKTSACMPEEASTHLSVL